MSASEGRDRRLAASITVMQNAVIGSAAKQSSREATYLTGFANRSARWLRCAHHDDGAAKIYLIDGAKAASAPNVSPGINSILKPARTSIWVEGRSRRLRPGAVGMMLAPVP